MDKETLLSRKLPERDVETVVGIIRCRGLSRAEVVSLQELTDDADALDNRMIELGVVAPKLTAEEAKTFRSCFTPEEIIPVTDAIAVLSGMQDTTEEIEARFR